MSSFFWPTRKKEKGEKKRERTCPVRPLYCTCTCTCPRPHVGLGYHTECDFDVEPESQELPQVRGLLKTEASRVPAEASRLPADARTPCSDSPSPLQPPYGFASSSALTLCWDSPAMSAAMPAKSRAFMAQTCCRTADPTMTFHMKLTTLNHIPTWRRESPGTTPDLSTNRHPIRLVTNVSMVHVVCGDGTGRTNTQEW